MLILYFRYGTVFDTNGRFPLPNGGGFGKNLIIFGPDMSLSVDLDKKREIS